MRLLIFSCLLVSSLLVHKASAFCPSKYITHSKPGYTNVHIFPSTHLDLGWTSTYQEYYDRYNEPLPLNTVLLKPMEIKSFLVRIRSI